MENKRHVAPTDPGDAYPSWLDQTSDHTPKQHNIDGSMSRQFTLSFRSPSPPWPGWSCPWWPVSTISSLIARIGALNLPSEGSQAPVVEPGVWSVDTERDTDISVMGNQALDEFNNRSIWNLDSYFPLSICFFNFSSRVNIQRNQHVTLIST